MAASSASICPCCEPRRAIKWISRSLVVSSLLAVMAGISFSSTSSRGRVRRSSISRMRAETNEIGMAKLLPIVFGRISAKRITATVNPTLKSSSAQRPPTVSKTWLAWLPSRMEPEMLKRLLITTSSTKARPGRALIRSRALDPATRCCLRVWT